jgi:hypothetical protein
MRLSQGVCGIEDREGKKTRVPVLIVAGGISSTALDFGTPYRQERSKVEGAVRVEASLLI